MPVDVVYQGGKFAQRGYDMYREVERLTPFDIFVSQGGYNVGGVSASAGTHDREAVDVSGSILTPDERWTVCTNMRRVGWAAWIRTPAQGFAYHVHGVPVNGDLSTAARAQVVQYVDHKNGLSGAGPDDGPTGYYDMTWEKYQTSSAYRPPIDIPSEEDPLAAFTRQDITDIVNDELQSFFNHQADKNGEGFDRIIQAANKSLEQTVRTLVNDELQSFFDHRSSANGEGFDRIVQAVNEALKQSGVTR